MTDENDDETPRETPQKVDQNSTETRTAHCHGKQADGSRCDRLFQQTRQGTRRGNWRAWLPLICTTCRVARHRQALDVPAIHATMRTRGRA